MSPILVALAALAGAALAAPESELSAQRAKVMTSDDGLVDVAGATVRIRIEGPADAPPLVLLHGFTYSLESWDAWTRILKDDYRIIRYDLLGHGVTGPDPQGRYAPAERAAFLGEVMDTLGIEEAFVAGNSLGGLAAWRFAAMAPERVRGLILISPGAYPLNGVTEEPADIPPAVAMFLRTATDTGVRMSTYGLYGDPARVSDARVREIADMMRLEGNGEAMIASLGEFVLPDPSADLALVTSPVLIQWGGKDALIPPSQGERLAMDLPNATLVIYDDLGHVAHEEAPEATASDARAFLELVRKQD